ncbi:MAG: PKD domain-containing protein [Planctomycetes bacterium]|nr:PKD domain-containing protein [Planctomycetota bacterium]
MRRHALWGLIVLGMVAAGLPDAVVAAPPRVRCVLWQADASRPHDTWDGKDTLLKAVVDDPDGAADLQGAAYEMDFGDATPVATGTLSGPGAFHVAHTYAGGVGTPYVATLTVTDIHGEEGSDTYLVTVRAQNLTTEVNVAIDDGLWYLYRTQEASGRWTGYGSYVSQTASAVQAFEINGHLPTGDANQDPYVDAVTRGLDHMIGQLQTFAIGLQHGDDPDSNGNGVGIQVVDGYPAYQGGQVMDCLIASGAPGRVATTGPAGVIGATYAQIVQDMCDAYAWGQSDYDGSPGGGWRYSWQEWPDNSACQWGAIGMIPAEREWGATVPAWVKARNEIWLDYSFNAGSKWFGYTNTSAGNNASQACRPSGMVQIFMNGNTTADTRFVTTESWFATTTNWQWFLNSRSIYAWYAFAKAMRVALPDAVVTLSNGFNWYEGSDAVRGMARQLVEDQDKGPGATASRGSFPSSGHTTYPYSYGNSFATAWSVIILKPALFKLAPYAVAEATPNPTAISFPVSFDASLSGHNDPARTLIAYQWDFDASDGVDWANPDATGVTASHAYDALGTFVATLRVIDDSQPALSATTTVEVNVVPPPHDPTAVPGGPYTACPGETVVLDGSGSFDIDEGDPTLDPPDGITAWGWEIDNAAPFDFDDATGEIVTHAWATPGVYNVGLKVTDNYGRTNIAWTTVSVDAKYCIGTVDLCPDLYRWGTPVPGFRWDPFPMVFEGWQHARLVNNGTGTAFNVTATVTCAPSYVQVVDGAMSFGDIGPGEAKFSLDSFTIRITMVPPPPRNQGILYRVEYDDARGVHHVVEDVPKFCGEDPSAICP